MSAKELNIGDYVRTKNLGGSIEKIIKVIPKEKTLNLIENYVTDVSAKYSVAISKNEIIKSSPNIIDLIEVGDYVNGDRVKALKGDIESHKINNEEDVIYTEYINDYDEWCGYEEDEIKSIVTKEQFESIEYKIGGDK